MTDSDKVVDTTLLIVVAVIAGAGLLIKATLQWLTQRRPPHVSEKFSPPKGVSRFHMRRATL
ncbi:hypothetical protein [Altericroceibacterium xinjiangense]|uniref:hypothetical protein n=1 Tax=Altericroceibacterium xinjiangense TaxID=762261 RepID=UPI000F7ED174|nr:hypothetical protein [Altericroceibacterium xinjiangense]